MAAASSPAISQHAKNETLRCAVHEFESVLDDSQRLELRRMKDVPSVDTVLTFTAELDLSNRQRKGRSFASRLFPILDSVRSFCSVVDTFVSSRPETAALVWGSVRITMLLVANYSSYYEATSELFLKLGRLCPLYSDYLSLFPSSIPLQKSLADFHASIIRCCKHMIQVLRRPWHNQIIQALASFQQEFKPDIDGIRNQSDNVKHMIELAKTQADHEDQRLQHIERKVASRHRSWMTASFSRANDELHKIQEMQLRSNTRKSQKKRQQLLQELSAYPYRRLQEQSRRKRHGNTASWMFHLKEFQDWLGGGLPLIWCSGKIGSGKTITASSVVDYLFRNNKDASYHVSFFFVQPDDQDSLNADTILRSILRQRLDSIPIPQTVEETLSEGDLSCRFDVIDSLLCQVMQAPDSRTSYILVDGLDECEQQDRRVILATFSSLIQSTKRVRIFLSSRASLLSENNEISKLSTGYHHVSLDCQSTYRDISAYISDTIDDKLEKEELIIGDTEIVEEIKAALVNGAQGMFLWAVFQIYDICSQHCDADIRKVLADLPSDLEKTFSRALHRIEARKYDREAARVFPWIAASKRLLSLGELREAISVEIGQQHLKRENLWNDMKNVTSWCENLVEVDEDNQLIQFAHSSVRRFLLGNFTESSLERFHVNFKLADHHIGEVCVTYLGFNDFQRTLTRRVQPLVINTPLDIAKSAVGPGSKTTSKLMSMVRPKKPTPVDLASLSMLKKDNIQLEYHFLEYASVFWLEHTKDFDAEKSKSWKLWKQLVQGNPDHVKFPWVIDQADDSNSSMLQWMYTAGHYGLLHLVVHSKESIPAKAYQMALDKPEDLDVAVATRLRDTQSYPTSDFLERLFNASFNAGNRAVAKIAASRKDWPLLCEAAIRGHLKFVEALIEAGADINASSAYGGVALQQASRRGHLGIVETLLKAGAKINATNIQGLTALQEASRYGHLEIAKTLLIAGAEINATDIQGLTALHEASQYGHLGIVKTLLKAGAEINATDIQGVTILQKASRYGHLEIVKTLFNAGAEINAADKQGLTALQEASQQGGLQIVKALLEAGAEIGATDIQGLTALQKASRRGHLGIVKTLLKAGAKINATNIQGLTALQEASRCGYSKIVEILLKAGADVNMATTDGRTALLEASKQGNLETVKALLKAGAEIDAADLEGLTALQKASQQGHLQIVETLLEAGADVNAVNADGQTALQAASLAGQPNVVNMLCKAGAGRGVFSIFTER